MVLYASVMLSLHYTPAPVLPLTIVLHVSSKEPVLNCNFCVIFVILDSGQLVQRYIGCIHDYCGKSRSKQRLFSEKLVVITYFQILILEKGQRHLFTSIFDSFIFNFFELLFNFFFPETITRAITTT